MARRAVKKKEREQRQAKPPRPKLETEERTIEHLESLPPLARALGVHLYLVASFWPWWATLFPVALLLRALFRSEALTWIAGGLLVLAIGGAFAKPLVERLAPGWAARAGE